MLTRCVRSTSTDKKEVEDTDTATDKGEDKDTATDKAETKDKETLTDILCIITTRRRA